MKVLHNHNTILFSSVDFSELNIYPKRRQLNIQILSFLPGKWRWQLLGLWIECWMEQSGDGFLWVTSLAVCLVNIPPRPSIIIRNQTIGGKLSHSPIPTSITPHPTSNMEHKLKLLLRWSMWSFVFEFSKFWISLKVQCGLLYPLNIIAEWSSSISWLLLHFG